MAGLRRLAHRALVGCLLVGVGVLVVWPSVLGGAPWPPTLADGGRTGVRASTPRT
ncbi:hypothetical protein [Halogeometricum sp. CBA1124]|uniref:hypothetical protein n=1 Tax=Halogeometricum sp. CBA1124 TaxID=2668071 RepID=UPI0014299E99|nr:hypothetical protein [Halogeometricum sp. CBA1124]MUV57330.1 hypothetical protein [Halogeometricum sp. CBA1124]